MEDVGLWSGSLFNLPSQVQVNHGSSELPYEVQFPRFFPSSPLETRCRVGLKDSVLTLEYGITRLMLEA